MPRGRPLSQVEAEDLLQVELDHLEALTNGGLSPKLQGSEEERTVKGFDQVCDEAGAAEVAWKLAQARQMITFANAGNKDRRDIQEARALVMHAEEFRAYKMTAQAKDSASEALKTAHRKADGYRTLNANIRAQT